jgi:hypothetical protein
VPCRSLGSREQLEAQVRLFADDHPGEAPRPLLLGRALQPPSPQSPHYELFVLTPDRILPPNCKPITPANNASVTEKSTPKKLQYR